ncbi:hypothetical protein HK097_008799 [Rhizophlyctis rosea]|uniref:Uncharacterized protein n=1 Tax=Rhizophlyctis rosea TaxID=64517 RepID=A0AAD5X7R3_9FUNG|nr:hypothetical protein HK097_008799 [Rhizophlyctis rosea]
MKLLNFLLATFVVGAVRGASLVEDDAVGEIIPKRFLVKLEAGTATTESGIKDYIIKHLAGQDDIHISANQIRFRHVINSSLYRGASFEISTNTYNDEELTTAIRRLPKSVGTPKPVRRFRPKKEGREDQQPRRPKVSIVPPEFSAQAYHMKTGVGQLHKKGIFGKGIKVGIIDSGIYYKHPALGGGLGPGYKVAYGRTFADDPTSEGDETPEDCFSHGTHVAGIIAGNATGITDPEWKPAIEWRGVAPQATLGAYRVAGTISGICFPIMTDDAIVAAFYQAQKDGMQIINFSVGGTNPWTGGAIMEAVEAVEKAGVIVVVSAGNDGHLGGYTISSPSSSSKALAVGAINAFKLWENVLKGPFGKSFHFLRSLFGTTWDPLLNQTVKIIKGEFGSPANALSCAPLLNPATVNGTVVVYVSDKVNTPPPCLNPRTCVPCSACQTIQLAGATGCIAAVDGESRTSWYAMTNIPTGTVTSQTAGDIFKVVAANPEANWQFTDAAVKTTTDNGGESTTFTSIGLTQDLQIKPDVSGMGGQIYSTTPPGSLMYPGPYGYMDGTSMSAPYVCGVLALYLQVHQSKHQTPEAVRAIIRNSATPVHVDVPKNNKTTISLIGSVAQQGGGLINAPAAIFTTTIVSPSTLALNDTVRIGKTERTIRIENQGTKRVTYRLEHVPAALLETTRSGTDKYWRYSEDMLKDVKALVKFSTNTVNILPGRSAAVKVKFTIPKYAGLPIYSGFLRVTSSDKKQVLQIPYAGVIGDISTRPIISRQPLLGPNDSAQSIGVSPTSYGSLYLNFSIATATRLLKTEIISLNTTTPIGTLKYTSPLSPTGTLAGVVSNINRHPTGNSTEQVTSVISRPWKGKLYQPAFIIDEILSANFSQIVAERNFTRIPVGNYTIRLSGLKVFGDLRRDRDFDVWETNVFEVKADTFR